MEYCGFCIFIFLLNPESSIPIYPIYPGDAWDGSGWMFSTSENNWSGQRLDTPEAVDLLAGFVGDLVGKRKTSIF